MNYLLTKKPWSSLDALPEPILMVTVAGKIVRANRAALQWLSLPKPFVPEAVTLASIIEMEEKELARRLKLWQRSTSMVPSSLLVKDPKTQVNRVMIEAAAVRQANEDILILIRFRLQKSVLSQFVALKEEIWHLNQKLAKQRQQSRELQDLANRDALTQIANRRTLERRLSVSWLAVQSQNSCLSIIILDIDYFKAYNDTYGHLAGDSCLRQVAQAIQQQSRQDEDLVARYGGEEFVVVSASSVETALLIAERIVAAIRDLQISHRASPFGQVTVSAGLSSQTHSPVGSWQQLLDLADQALYKAKQGGRDRVHCYGQ